MNIPMKVKVGAKEYNIIETNTIREDDAQGECNHAQQIIAIYSGLNEQEKQITFLHELLHAICWFSGVGSQEKMTEEQWISRITPALFTVLEQNELYSKK